MSAPSEDTLILQCGPKSMNIVIRKIYWEELGYESETVYYKLNLKMDLKLGGKYKMSKKLGSGAFGEIFLAKELATWEEVAVKEESNRTRHSQLICNTHLEKKRISKNKLAIAFSNKTKAKRGEDCIQDESC